MSMTEKVAYLKGLADGIGLDEKDSKDKLLKAMIDALDEIAAMRILTSSQSSLTLLMRILLRLRVMFTMTIVIVTAIAVMISIVIVTIVKRNITMLSAPAAAK